MMLMQIGFSLPLLIIMGLEAMIGVLLLCPKPINQPAIALARATNTQIGSTVFHTLAGVLLLLLASPIYDATRLFRASKAAGDQTSTLDTGDQEAQTLLSFVLTSACLVMMYFLRKLGWVLGELDHMSVSEAALLKQVKGLQSEYSRMADSTGLGGTTGGTATQAGEPSAPTEAGAGTSGAAAGEKLEGQDVGELRRVVAELQETNTKLNAQLKEANQVHQLTESNLAALKTQSKGLENEYDRLLAEHDKLRGQLQRAGLVEGGVADSHMGKKEE